MTISPERISKLKELAGKATPVEPRDLMAYEHGGGRLAVIRDGRRDLIADFYGDGADRDYYAAIDPATLTSILEEIEGLRAAAGDVLSHRVGNLPGRGWLADNDSSRLALAKLKQVTDGVTQ